MEETKILTIYKFLIEYNQLHEILQLEADQQSEQPKD